MGLLDDALEAQQKLASEIERRRRFETQHGAGLLPAGTLSADKQVLFDDFISRLPDRIAERAYFLDQGSGLLSFHQFPTVGSYSGAYNELGFFEARNRRRLDFARQAEAAKFPALLLKVDAKLYEDQLSKAYVFGWSAPTGWIPLSPQSGTGTQDAWLTNDLAATAEVLARFLARAISAHS